MCGIIGILGKRPVAPLLVEGLRRLEYRGYDSAGIASLVNGRIERRRAEGKIQRLEAELAASPLPGTVGIGHTRWATHGAPTVTNAHPHATERVALVHNGIIENFQELRAELEGEGVRFETETDTEVVAHLLTRELNGQKTPEEAVAAVLPRLSGAFALAILFAGRHDLMIGARRGSPLAIGYGEGEMYLGSDALALAPLTQRICYLEEDDWAVVSPAGATIHDRTGSIAQRPIRLTALSGALIGKGNYRHFMEKEIWEQPGVLGDTLRAYIDPLSRTVRLPKLPFDWRRLPKLTIVGCGTAYLAGMVAKYWFERLAHLPVEIDIGSEFRYREGPLPKGGAALFVSQSGETIDTLAALAYARSCGQHILSVVNVAESAMARDSDLALRTLAGPEIGVASTKAFTTQLMVLACLAVAAARARGAVTVEEEAELVGALAATPGLVTQVLDQAEEAREVAERLAQARDVLYLGRGTAYPIALEGALKLKELSYLHAEGYAAGEMKHGPIALIDDAVPVIVVAPSGELFEKTASNLQEAVARGAQVVLISDERGLKRAGGKVAARLRVPSTHPFAAPIVYAAPVQLLAYYAALAKGTDVDQPRNLAKSVTVE
ncbi:MAG TPA: glutamine--fructose-6-phosphate transaminase (isomerizing) [Alphaproteobacteria bacterium]|nr:glutamine--fructose-6-phosphate transaminase (isomerizing) [Alphaproteobacteria bacterium]